MPLPLSDPKAAWPPADMQPLFSRMRQWSALYSGDLAVIQAAFGGGSIQDQSGFFASDKGGFRGAIASRMQRFFLGEPTQGGERNTKVPIPIAAEICQGSADLLYAEPFQVTVGRQAAVPLKPGNPTEVRLQTLLDDRFFASIAEAGELAAAVGGAFLRVTFDDAIPGRPFTTIVAGDNAIPEFRFGRLTAVTFWWVVKTVGDDVWRHLERHELSAAGIGVIRHGLYQGTAETLGDAVPLTGDTSTASLDLKTDLGQPGTITTGTPGLAVQYLPNQTPNRGWRAHATGQYLGRSDLDGIEHLIDQLAEVMSSWLRAIRLAKARLFVAKQLTQSAGPGNGVVANLEKEAYVAVDLLAGENPSLQDLIHLEQPVVAFEQYQATAKALVEQILQMAGYSPHTFGIEDGSHASGGKTATEVNSRDRRSDLTRSRKIRSQKPGISEHVEKLLAVDKYLYGTDNVLEGLDVVFPEGATQSDLQVAQAILALYQSESISTQERVARANTSWDDDQIQAEVDRIQAEYASDPMPDFPPLGVTVPSGAPGQPGDAGDPDDPTPEE